MRKYNKYYKHNVTRYLFHREIRYRGFNAVKQTNKGDLQR